MPPILLCWSGGKDSALALSELQQRAEWNVVGLLTTVTEGDDRISMHGVRRELLHRQAEALGLPLTEVAIARGANNAEYEARMGNTFSHFRDRGVSTVAFGDIFLEDLKQYREAQLARLGMVCQFPLWGRDTRELIDSFLTRGFRAMTAVVDPRALDRRFVGREIDTAFVNELPANVDPCGENGEYHSFVFDGPNFRRPVPVVAGEIVARDSFLFCDLLSDSQRQEPGAKSPEPERHDASTLSSGS